MRTFCISTDHCIAFKLYLKITIILKKIVSFNLWPSLQISVKVFMTLSSEDKINLGISNENRCTAATAAAATGVVF